MSLEEQLSKFKSKVSNRVVDAMPRVNPSTSTSLRAQASNASAASFNQFGLKRNSLEDRIREQAALMDQEQALAEFNATKNQSYLNSAKKKQTDIKLNEMSIPSLIYKIISHLKAERKPKSVSDILIETGIDIVAFDDLLEALKINPKINYLSDSDKFEFKPQFKVNNSTDLLKIIKNRYDKNIMSESKFPVALDLKNMADCNVDVKPLTEELAVENKIFLLRGKEDIPKTVYYNEYLKPCEMDQEFKSIWRNIKVPGDTDMFNSMKRANLKVMESFEKKIVEVKAKKARVSNREIKRTNTHLPS